MTERLNSGALPFGSDRCSVQTPHKPDHANSTATPIITRKSQSVIPWRPAKASHWLWGQRSSLLPTQTMETLGCGRSAGLLARGVSPQRSVDERTEFASIQTHYRHPYEKPRRSAPGGGGRVKTINALTALGQFSPNAATFLAMAMANYHNLAPQLWAKTMDALEIYSLNVKRTPFMVPWADEIPMTIQSHLAFCLRSTFAGLA